MPFDFTKESSAAISTTEYSLPAASTTLAAQTDTCMAQLMVNILAMAAGDSFIVRLYEKVISTGAQKLVDSWRLQYPQDFLLMPAIVLHNGWDITIQKVAGTDRTVEWSIRKVV